MKQNSASDDASADAPLIDKEHDAFNRFPFAVRIADMIKRRQGTESVVTGLYGQWGEGKTTVLEFIKRELEKEAELLIFTFNPWRFGNDEQLLWAFFAGLSSTLQKPLQSKGERLAGKIAEYGELIIPNVDVAWGIASIPAGKGISTVAKKLSQLNVDEARKRVEKALLSAKRRVVVIMDDIDRLDCDEIRQVLKLVKLTANFPYVDYLLAFDDDVVAAALAKSFGNGQKDLGAAFLEKIVQIPLRLPMASESSLRRYCLTAVDGALKSCKVDLSSDEVQAFVREFDDSITPLLTTPRTAWRYSNALRFALPLIKDEGSAVDFMLLEAARLFVPEIYEFIKAWGANIIQYQQMDTRDTETTQKLRAILESLSAERRKSSSELVRFLLPQAQQVIGSGGFFGGNMTYSDSTYMEWAKCRRMCIREYFPRYFSFAVPEDDFSEVALQMLLLTAKSGGEAVRDFVRLNSTEKNVEALLRKVYRHVDDMEIDAATGLAAGFALCGDLFSDSGKMMSVSLSTSAAILIEKLIKRGVARDHQDEFARSLVETISPLYFAIECLRMFQPSKDENDRGVLSETSVKALSKTLALRAVETLMADVPWTAHRNSFLRMLFLVRRELGKTKVKQCLDSHVKNNPMAARELIANFTGKSYPLDTGIAKPSDFEHRDLENLEYVYSAKQVYDLIRSEVGTTLDVPNRYAATRFDGPDRLVAQFLRVYQDSLKKKSTRPKAELED